MAGEFEAPGEHAPRVARVDDVVDVAPAADFVDVDVLLELVDEGFFFASGGGSTSPKTLRAAMPTMPSAPMTLTSPPGHETMRSGSKARPAMT